MLSGAIMCILGIIEGVNTQLLHETLSHIYLLFNATNNDHTNST